MTYTNDVNPSLIQQWIAEKLDPQQLRDNLLSQGWDESIIKNYIREYRRVKNAKRLSIGFICLATGAFLGFISCVLTILNPIPELYNWILYGLTSLALLILFLGLYYIME